MNPIVPILGLLVLCVASLSEAATIRVERDGSGDFSTLQAAVDFASPGDVIEVGPGTYSETTQVEGTITFHINAWVTTDDLTIRGVDRDSVIVGPSEGPPTLGERGIVQVGSQRITVENVTFQNLDHGVGVANERVVVRNCRFLDGNTGIASEALYETLVEGCEFRGNVNAGTLVYGGLGSTGVLVRASHFEGNSMGVDLQTQGNIVENCTFLGNVVGLQFSFGASGTVMNCDFEDNNNGGIAVGLGSTGTLLNNRVRAGTGAICLDVSSSHVSGTANTFEGGSFVTILLGGEGTLDLQNGHIIPDPGQRCVWTKSGQGTGHIIDLRNNYWGTNSAEEIAECITDSNDYPQLTGTVLFEPFAGQPVSTEQTSFGAVKAGYGPRDE